tara:strand:- start:3216 stop:4808 length:1593 start_codon:yes stop_codon:yes gene_type:complete
MAGKETPRQKMINMMYLIFIAMLALNLSKQILQSFGTMNEELTATNVQLVERNEQFMQSLIEKTREDSKERDKYLDLKLKADSIRTISSGFYDFLNNIKEGAFQSAEENGISRSNYSKLDNTTYYTSLFFDGQNYKELGQQFLDEMNKFRDGFVEIASSDPKLVSIANEVEKKFSTGDVEVSDGKPRRYLDYHFKDMPLIVGITKISLLQSSLQNLEAQLLSTILEGKLKIEASLTNFDAIVIPDKNAFFAGENFTGRIILGKNDKTLKANKVTINGNELDEDAMQEGQTLLDFNVGYTIGTRDIVGEFIFTEDGEQIPIEVKSQYEVINRPNKAIISAEKMKVIYRGVPNPISVSIPGINDNRISVNAPGIKKINGTNYIIDLSGEIPQALQGKDSVNIRAVGQLEGGQQVSSFETFRIKGLPRPIATIAGNVGLFEFGKEDLKNTSLRARFDESFAYDLPVNVRSFTISVPGQPPITNRGRRMRDDARALIDLASRGDIVTISGIEVDAQGSEYILKKPLPLSVLITD